MAIKKRSKNTTRGVAVVKNSVSKQEFAQVESNQKMSFGKLFKAPRILIFLIIIIVALVLFYFKGLFVVALVNGQPISRLSVIQELEKRGGKQTLSSLITQALILQEARKRNVDVSQKEIDEEVKKVEDNMKKQGQSLDTALTFQGITRKDFMTQIKLRKLVDKMLEKDVKVTDKEVKDYIEKNKNDIPKNMKPEDLSASAKQRLKQEKFQQWLQKLQSTAKVQYFVNY